LAKLSKITEESARGGFFLFSGTALSSIILAVSVIFLGRFMGPELYGQFSLVIVVPTFLMLLTDLGISAGVTKFTASFREEGKTAEVATIIRRGMLLRLAIGVALALLTVIFADYFALLINRPELSVYIQLVAFSVVFHVVYSTANSAFVGLDRSEYSALITNVQALSRASLQIGLVLFGFSITGALIGYVGGLLVASVLGVFLLVRFFKHVGRGTTVGQHRFSETFKKLFRFGMPVYASVVLVGLFPLFQQVVLAFFSSDAAIGNFRAAYNFASLLLIILTSISTALLPAFSKLESSPELVNMFFKRVTKYTCLIIVPSIIFLILFSTPIVELIYGTEYHSAPFFLSLSCLPYLLVGIGYLTLNSLFTGLGKTTWLLKVTLLNFIFLLCLSPILAQAFDVTGVIIANLISSIVASIYSLHVGLRYLKISFDVRMLLKIYTVATFSTFPVLTFNFFFPLSSLFALVFGLLIYFAVFVSLMPLTRIVNRSELAEMSRIIGDLPLISFIAKKLFGYQKRLLVWAEFHLHD
jgi:O-antigen/teichoic acid export membrane protein